MSATNFSAQLDNQLCRALARYHVKVSQPRARMLQLEGVPIGPDFNHPCTNVLLRGEGSRPSWQVFVDEDLVYQGGDPARQAMFQGDRRRGWRPLQLRGRVCGDVNAAVLRTLDLLESDICRDSQACLTGTAFQLAPAGEQESGALVDRRLGRELPLDQLRADGVEPTESQAEAILQAAETVTRRYMPSCPVLTGPSGCGKTLVARLAAGTLADRGLIQHVVEVRAAGLSAGAVFLADRDERLRAALSGLNELPETLVILDRVDLALTRSGVAAALLADALEQGLRLIAVGQNQARPRLPPETGPLRRRLEPIAVAPPGDAELVQLLNRQLERHPLADQLECSPAVVPLVARFSSRRRGANPGAALGLLEAVVNRAAFAGHLCVGPDDVYHLFADETVRE